MDPLHMLRTIWRVPVPEGDGDIVEEMTRPADRSTWPADDADKVKSKDGVVFIFFACRPRSCLLTPVVDDNSTLYEVKSTRPVESLVVRLGNELVS
jgi:hypothetical protein